MNVIEELPFGARNALIVVAVICVFLGVVVRETNEANRGLGMALIVVAASLFLLAMVGRHYGWW